MKYKTISALISVCLLSLVVPISSNNVQASSESFSTWTTRLKGQDRYETAVAISQVTYSPGIPVVYVVTGEKSADALAASALAGAAGGAVLLTRTASLPSVTRAELIRLAPTTIVVLGGVAAVSDPVVAEIRSALPNTSIRRDAGATRYETAVEASRQAVTETGGTVYLGSGLGFTEVIAASVAAARDRAPLLLVPGTGPSAALPLAVASELRRLDPVRVRIVGGTNLVAPTIEQQVVELLASASVTRIPGGDAYETAAAIAAEGSPARPVWVATGDVFADGLGGAAAAAKVGASLVMVPRSGSLTPAMQNTLLALAPTSFTILGGDMAVSPATAREVSVHRAGFVSVFTDPSLASSADVQRLVHMSLRTAARYGMDPGAKLTFYSKEDSGIEWAVQALNDQQCQNQPRQYLEPILRGNQAFADAMTGCGYAMRMGVGFFDLPFGFRTRLVTAAHEMYHVFQGQKLKDCSCGFMLRAGVKADRWFLEGGADVAGFTMAYGESNEFFDVMVRQSIPVSGKGRGDIGFEQLEASFNFPGVPLPYGVFNYARAHLAVIRLIQLTSFDTVMFDIYDRIAALGDFDRAFEETFGMTVDQYDVQFQAWLNQL